MTNLSQSAQAVLDAATQKLYCLDPEDVPISASEYGSVIAAALRAAADRVVPEPSDHLPEQNCRWYRLGVSAYRHNILAIADELEAQ